MHDGVSEIWLAPSVEAGESAGWRNESRCVAIASQVALTVDWARNARAASSSKL